jgi:hypothetical protein
MMPSQRNKFLCPLFFIFLFCCLSHATGNVVRFLLGLNGMCFSDLLLRLRDNFPATASYSRQPLRVTLVRNSTTYNLI